MRIRMNQAVTSVAAFALAMGLAASVNAQEEIGSPSLEQLLQSLPLSLETHGTLFEGRQAIIDIPRNLETLYGVGCVLEVRYIGKNRPEPFPSPELDYALLKVTEETTLREFLDRSCSEGMLVWAIVYNAIHIWPTTMRPEKEEYLDTVRVSLDLRGVSVLDALKAWARAVNTNRRLPGHGVGIKHTFYGVDLLRNRATPTSLMREGAVTLKLENVTAREALCAIQGASREWVRMSYHHSTDSRDLLLFFPSQAEMNATPEVTAEERHALDLQENLESVLAAPASDGGESE